MEARDNSTAVHAQCQGSDDEADARAHAQAEAQALQVAAAWKELSQRAGGHNVVCLACVWGILCGCVCVCVCVCVERAHANVSQTEEYEQT